MIKIAVFFVIFWLTRFYLYYYLKCKNLWVFLSLKEVRAIQPRRSSKKNLKRGFLCAIGYNFINQNKAVYAADQPVVLIEDQQWRKLGRTFSGNVHIWFWQLGLFTWTCFGVVIYHLIIFLKTTLNRTDSKRKWSTTIGELMEKN
jgi:hypothetical protein